MFDKKTSCLMRGIVGVLFGFLALILPDIIKGAFYALFWVLILLGIAAFVFLAITARGDESMLWFGMAAVLLIIGVLSVIVAKFVAILLILIIAAIAGYNGFTDITMALTHPKTKFILIPGMIAAGVGLLLVLFYYFPGFESDLLLSIVGTFALVFGLFSIMLGFYRCDEIPGGDESSASSPPCTTHRPGARK